MSSHWWASPESPQRLVQGDAARQRQGSESLERRLPAGLRHGTLLPSTGLGCGLPHSKSSRQQFVPAQTRSCQQPAGSPSGGHPLCQGLRCQPGTWWHHSHSSHQRRPAEGQGRARVCLTPDLATQPRRHVRGRRLQSRSTASAPPWSRGPRSGPAPSPRLRPSFRPRPVAQAPPPPRSCALRRARLPA